MTIRQSSKFPPTRSHYASGNKLGVSVELHRRGAVSIQGCLNIRANLGTAQAPQVHGRLLQFSPPPGAPLAALLYGLRKNRAFAACVCGMCTAPIT